MKIPYFYIIQHKDTGIKYAGAKWGVDANPDSFMNDSGYLTSSTKINEIVSESASIQFSIIDIILESDLKIPFGCQDIQSYEYWFLEENKCTASFLWYNRYHGIPKPHDSIEFKKNMLSKYGVEHAMHHPDLVAKQRQSFLENNTPEERAEFRARAVVSTKKTNRIRYGVDSYTNRDQINATNTERYGGNAPACSDTVKNLAKQTCREKYVGDSSMCDPLVLQKRDNTFLAKYGGHPINTKEFQEKRSNTSWKKYGYSGSEKVAYICEHCGKSGRGIGNYKKYHHNRCKLNLFGIISDDPIGLILFPQDPNNPFGESF